MSGGRGPQRSGQSATTSYTLRQHYASTTTAMGEWLRWADADDNGVVAPALILYQWVRTNASKALGHVLTTFCKALALLQSITIEGPTRMMDSALLGEAVTIVMLRKPKDEGSLK